MLSFQGYQKFADRYWKNLDRIMILYFLFFFLIIFLFWFFEITFQPADGIMFGVTILAVLVQIFGFGIAFIGSQTIQYSVTKILLRYRFLQLFNAYCCFVIGAFVIHGFDPSIDISLLLLSQIFIAVYLYVHTFLLIDKMFEPEELIVDVIVPMILHFENALIDLQKKDSNIDSVRLQIYSFLLSRQNENLIQPLCENPTYASLIDPGNGEYSAFNKAIFRLVNTHALKLRHLLDYLAEGFRNKTLNLNQMVFHKDYKITYESYYWFLMTVIISQICLLVRMDSKYDFYLSKLLTYLVPTILCINTNKKLPEGKKQHGTLDSVLSMILLLDDKNNLLKVMHLFYARDNQYQDFELHEDKDQQIENITDFVIEDFFYNTYRKVVNETALDNAEALILIQLVQLVNTAIIIKGLLSSVDIDRKQTSDTDITKGNLMQRFCEFIIFIEAIRNSMEMHTSRTRMVIRTYYQLLFSTKNWPLFKKIIQTKLLNGFENLSVKNEAYRKLFEQAYSEFSPSNNSVIEEIQSEEIVDIHNELKLLLNK